MWKLDAPSSKANAARNPPDIRPSAPEAAIAWNVNTLRPR